MEISEKPPTTGTLLEICRNEMFEEMAKILVGSGIFGLLFTEGTSWKW